VFYSTYLFKLKLSNSHLAVHAETLLELSSPPTASWPTETLCTRHSIRSATSASMLEND